MKPLIPHFFFLSFAATLAFTASAHETNSGSLPAGIDLPTALRFALDHNFSILQARERIKEQEGVLIQTRAAAIPNLVLNSQYQQTDKTLQESFGGSGVRPNNQSWSITLEATQALFSGGKFTSAIRSERDVRQAALYELQGVINDVLLDLRSKFYAVLLNQEKIKVQEQNLQLLEQQYKNAKSRYEAGTGAQFELLRTEVAMANGRPPLIQARNTYRISLEQLRQALGLIASIPGGGPAINIVGSLEAVPAEFDLESALSAARANRPELLRYASLHRSQDENIRVAQADYWPTLGVFGGYEIKKKNFTTNLDSTLDGWIVGLQSTWAIFDGRATAGKVAQARSHAEQARLTLLNEQLSIEVEVRQAYSSFQEASELVSASAKTVEEAEEAVRQAQARYNAGSATQLDVLSVQVDLTTARTNQLEANYNYNVAVAALRRAMGAADKFELQN